MKFNSAIFIKTIKSKHVKYIQEIKGVKVRENLKYVKYIQEIKGDKVKENVQYL